MIVGSVIVYIKTARVTAVFSDVLDPFFSGHGECTVAGRTVRF